jgi:hypothetical protein
MSIFASSSTLTHSDPYLGAAYAAHLREGVPNRHSPLRIDAADSPQPGKSRRAQTGEDYERNTRPREANADSGARPKKILYLHAAQENRVYF